MGLAWNRPIADKLIQGLRQLEYRGYDSAGIALVDHQGLKHCKTKGKVHDLFQALSAKNPQEKSLNTLWPGHTGIAHTRWATHGEPSEKNAHPHTNGRIAVVHNGIIHNADLLKSHLEKKGYIFHSDTDTEVALHLLDFLGRSFSLDKEQPVLCPRVCAKLLDILQGNFALGILSRSQPDTAIGIRKGSSPLALGKSAFGYSLSSDAIGLMGLGQELFYVPESSLAFVSAHKAQVWSLPPSGTMHNVDLSTLFSEPVPSAPLSVADLGTDTPLTEETIRWETNTFYSLSAQKEGYPHFMLKEIYEQPAIIDRLVALAQSTPFPILKSPYLGVTGCGTALISGLAGKHFFETFARITLIPEVASELIHRQHTPPHPLLAISQSGETMDTLKAVLWGQQRSLDTYGLVNVPQSSLARLCPECVYTLAGLEIGVASTKAFIAQTTQLLLWALHQSHRLAQEKPHLDTLGKVVAQTLDRAPTIQQLGKTLGSAKTIFFLGRHIHYPVALEGALKMKELAYIPTEGLPTGELKHGPLALMDADVHCVLLAPYIQDSLWELNVSNAQEILARKAKVHWVTDAQGAERLAHSGALEKQSTGLTITVMPDAKGLLSFFPSAVFVQLLAYYTALERGCAIDQPRHLAKSVTVE